MTDDTQDLMKRLRQRRYNTWKDDLGPDPEKAKAAEVIEKYRAALDAADAEIEQLREHAEKLADLLREALEELDDYYRAEYDTDHPYHKDKLARARDAWAPARALLARTEGGQP